MRQIVESQRKAEKYDAFLDRKVEAARKSVDAGQGRSDAAVEADFAARRAAATMDR